MSHPWPSTSLDERIRALEEALAEYAGLYGLTDRARAVMPADQLDRILLGHGQVAVGALTATR